MFVATYKVVLYILFLKVKHKDIKKNKGLKSKFFIPIETKFLPFTSDLKCCQPKRNAALQRSP